MRSRLKKNIKRKMIVALFTRCMRKHGIKKTAEQPIKTKESRFVQYKFIPLLKKITLAEKSGAWKEE